jgi:hypothetical protein
MNEQTEQQPENFPLDDAAIEALAEYDQQERTINVARSAVLAYFLRQHKMTGEWQIAPNRKELVRAQTQQPQLQPGPLPIMDARAEAQK